MSVHPARKAVVGESQPRDAARAGSYHIETWGCQMNVHDSEKLAGILEREGYVRAAEASVADVILLNTCSIREKAVDKLFGELGRLRPLKVERPGTVLGVCGCVGQQEGEAIFRRAPYVDFVIGPRAINSLPSTLTRLRSRTTGRERIVDTEYRNDSVNFPYDEIRREGTATGKAFVTVIEGCNHRCTYCVVPNTRGREICRDMDVVLDEVRSLVARDVKEIEFLGQTVNAYRDANGRTLAELLIATANVEGVRRIRFTTSHPAQMTDKLMDAMAAARPALCPYLHLPVQSGSSEVLRWMRRGYDRETYLRKIAGLRERIPEMLFGTDIIVGFPGETEAQFVETLELLDEVRFDTVYSFAYSPRPGTAAEGQPDDPPLALRMERLQRLQARQKEIQTERNRRWVGSELDVLVESRSRRDSSRWTGRCPGNRIVHFEEASAPGRVERVRIVGSTPFSLRGTRIESVFA